MLQVHNEAKTPSGEQIKLRFGITLREGGGMWRRRTFQWNKKRKKEVDPGILGPECGQLNKSGLLEVENHLSCHFRETKEVNLKMLTHLERWKMKHTGLLFWQNNTRPTYIRYHDGYGGRPSMQHTSQQLPTVSNIIHSGHASQDCYPITFRPSGSNCKCWKVQLGCCCVYRKMSEHPLGCNEIPYKIKQTYTSSLQATAIAKINTKCIQVSSAVTEQVQLPRGSLMREKATNAAL